MASLSVSERPGIQVAADRYTLELDLVSAAAAAREAGTRMLVVSGKMGSGKDTIAPLVLQMLGARDPRSHSFARALKDELNEIIATIRDWGGRIGARPPLEYLQRAELALVIAERHTMDPSHALEWFAGDLADEVLTDATVHSRSRTPTTRAALQRLGTDVRRAADQLYWVRASVRPMLTDVAAGLDVVSTDGRFPNEIAAVQDFGGIAVRIDISEDEQLRRIIARDGFAPSQDALLHESETALDDYAGFDVRVTNDGQLPDTLEQIRTQLVERDLL